MTDLDPYVVDAIASGRTGEARAIVFEYMAATQAENGKPVPGTIEELPAVLYAECADLATAYQPPGVLLLAYLGGVAVGCVGLRPATVSEVVELKRLFVRPAVRRLGIARELMYAALRHTAEAGFGRVVADVLPSRTHVIAFYRSLGFMPTEPLTIWPVPMVWLGRDV